MQLPQHVLKRWTVKIAAGIAVIHKFPHKCDVVAMAIVLNHLSLVCNTGGFAASCFLIGKTKISKNKF